MARPKSRKSKFGKPPSSSESNESNDTLGSSDSDFIDETLEPRSQRNDFIESSVRTELTNNIVSNDAAFEVILNQLSIEANVTRCNSNDRLLNVSDMNDNDDNMNLARDEVKVYHLHEGGLWLFEPTHRKCLGAAESRPPLHKIYIYLQS